MTPQQRIKRLERYVKRQFYKYGGTSRQHLGALKEYKEEKGKIMHTGTPTKVIFRKIKKTGELIALFPEIPGTKAWWADCMSYTDNSKFSPASVVIVDYTKRVDRKELRPFIEGMTGMGYNLKIVMRFQAEHLTARKQIIESDAYGKN